MENSLLEVINELVGDTTIRRENSEKTRKRSIENMHMMFNICNNFLIRLEKDIKEYKENGDFEALNACKESIDETNKYLDDIKKLYE